MHTPVSPASDRDEFLGHELAKVNVGTVTALPDGRVRQVLPSRLTDVESAFAMTVHKSQGSEFSHTVLLLPQHDSPILTRELVYTGITRARDRLTLVGSADIFRRAVSRRTVRHSGLAQRLG